MEVGEMKRKSMCLGKNIDLIRFFDLHWQIRLQIVQYILHIVKFGVYKCGKCTILTIIPNWPFDSKSTKCHSKLLKFLYLENLCLFAKIWKSKLRLNAISLLLDSLTLLFRTKWKTQITFSSYVLTIYITFYTHFADTIPSCTLMVH